MRTPAPMALVAVLPVLALLLVAGSPGALAAPEGPRVAVRTLDLSRVEGTLTALDGRSITLRAPGASAPRRFALDEVIHLSFEPRRTKPVEAPRFRAHLVGGEQLVGRYAGPAEDGILFEVPGLGRLTLLFEQVLTLESMPADAGPCHDVVGDHPRPETGDVAFDARGDEFAGTVLEATADELVLQSKRGRKLRLAWTGVRLVHLENEALENATGLRAEVELQNGSRLRVSKLGFLDKGLLLALRSVPGRTWTAAFDAVRAVRWKGGRFDYASDLPHEAVHTTYYPQNKSEVLVARFGERWWGTRVDRRASGCPLRVAGETFRHGFGVSSQCVITVPLGGRYATFRTSFGIDDEVFEEDGVRNRKGDVDARIVADGKVLWEAQGVRGGEKPRRVGPLDVRGVKSLVLEVGFGKELYTLDRGDWGDPILVKALRKAR